MTCSNCGTPNEEGRKFCGECGQALVQTCQICSTANPPTVKFCGECGSAFAPGERPPVAESSAVAETERRLVSVLFLDLVGFTTLAEGKDAEDVRTLLSDYFETAKSIIERHGGLVEKFIGDAVMAAWGTPTAHEDDAERAVRSALELVDAVEALGDKWELSMKARAGVVTGEAATRPSAVSEGMVAGDMVNTASRLQGAAMPGTVLVGDATVRSTRGTIAFEEVGPLDLKGKEEPFTSYRALRVVADVLGDPDLIEPPFIGRNEELRLLKEQLHGITRDGRARVVSVTGIGGIGKSRLAREFGRYIDGLTETFFWHVGRCPAYGDGITFWALGEMIRRRAGITEGDSTEEALAKLETSVETYVTDPEERSWVLGGLGLLLGYDETPHGSGEELFAAWRTFFERLAEAGPVVMVFEDLQWADQGLLDFIGSLLRWSRDHSILVVGLSRPEIADRRPDWGAGQRSFTSMNLEPLGADSMARLVRGLVADAPDDAVGRIVERSEGVPLYAVETIRMLADRGVLEARTHDYELVGSFEDLEVPETLHALIAARLDALPPADRSLVQDAAVLGKSFTAEALATMAGAEHSDIEPRLIELAKREILTVDADLRSPERGQFVFSQSLIREVAYGTLAKADRRERHVRAAELMEALEDDELAAAVAAHYVEALKAAGEGPERVSLAARARSWLRRASDRAMNLGSADQAVALVEQALPLTDDGRERRELLLLAARAAEDLVLMEQAAGYLSEAARLAAADGDGPDEIRILVALIKILHLTDQEQKEQELARDMVARFGESTNPNVAPYVSHALSYTRFLDGDHEGAHHATDAALGGYERLGDVENFVQLLSPKIFLLLLVGRGREATMLARGYVEWIRQHGDLRQLASALSTAGTTLTNEDPRGSFDLVMEGLEVSRRGGFGAMEVGLLTNGTESAIELGEFELAAHMIERLEEIPNLPLTDILAHKLNVANLAAYRGDTETAQAAIDSLPYEDKARSLGWVPRVKSVVATQSGDPEAGYELALSSIRIEGGGPNVPFALWAAARAALWSPDQMVTAAASVKTLLDETANLGGAWMHNARASLEAALAGLDGHREQAAAGFTEVLGLWRKMKLPFDHAATVGDAITLLGSGALPEGEVEAAVSYLSGIGAAPMLARITTTDPGTD